MVKIGDVLRLPVSSEMECDNGKRKGMAKRYADGTCIYVHPKERFAVFDFGYKRETFYIADLKAMGF